MGSVLSRIILPFGLTPSHYTEDLNNCPSDWKSVPHSNKRKKVCDDGRDDDSRKTLAMGRLQVAPDALSSRPLKRKGVDDSLQEPPAKRTAVEWAASVPQLVVGHLKRKASDLADGEPSAKRPSNPAIEPINASPLTIPSTVLPIVDLAVPASHPPVHPSPPVIPYIFRLPNELLSTIVSIGNNSDARTLAGVCHLLCDIVAPIYVQRLSLSVLPTSPTSTPCLFITSQTSLVALSIWRRSSTFKQIRTVYLWFSKLEISAGLQVNQFIHLLSTWSAATPFARRINLNLEGVGPIQSRRILHLIHRTGCTDLEINGVRDASTPSLTGIRAISTNSQPQSLPQLSSLHVMSSSFFTNSILLPWTLGTLCQAPIRELSLKRTGLSQSQWASLLPAITMPCLHILAIDGDVPLTTLVKFLERHSDIEELNIDTPTRLIHIPARKRHLSLSGLRSLIGPIHYVHGLLESTRVLPPLEQLGLLPDCNAADSALNTRALQHVLAKVVSCPHLCQLQLTLPKGPQSLAFLASSASMPRVERNLGVESVWIFAVGGLNSSLDEDLLVHYPRWLALFPKLRRVAVWEHGRHDRTEFDDEVHAVCPLVTAITH